MVWTIKLTSIAQKQMLKLDKSIAKKIAKYLRERVANQKNPTTFGKSLLHDKTGLWSYRVDDYRIICQFIDEEFVVLILQIGHRKEIYQKKYV